jgi:hypothetical protein
MSRLGQLRVRHRRLAPEPDRQLGDSTWDQLSRLREARQPSVRSIQTLLPLRNQALEKLEPFL